MDMLLYILQPGMLVSLGVLIVLTIAGSLLIGRKYRKAGAKPPALASRVIVCGCIAIVAAMAHVVAFAYRGIMTIAQLWSIATADQSLDMLIYPGVLMVFAICAYSAWQIARRWPISIKDIAKVIVVAGLASMVMPARVIELKTTSRIWTVNDLRGISYSLERYHKYQKEYPDDLRMIVDDRLDTYKLVSPSSSSGEKIPESWGPPYQGPCDYVYINLPKDAPVDLVWVWEPVEFNMNFGGHALLKGGKIRWMSADELNAEVARSNEWLERHASTQPAIK